MKRFHFIFFSLCVAVIFPSCRHRSYPAALLEADSLCFSAPDSALQVLASLSDNMASAPEREQMYYRLLCVKAQDRAHDRHDTDSLIFPVLHYYVNGGDRRLLAEAYYYAGRVYRSLNDAPQALDCFQHSLEAMSGGYENDWIRGRVYSQMGSLFAYQNMFEEALNIFQKAFGLDSLLNDSLNMLHDLRDMGWGYAGVSVSDSSLICYQKAYNLACQIHDAEQVKNVQSQLVLHYISSGEYGLAKSYLIPLLHDMEPLDTGTVYFLASEVYLREQKMDSAKYYYEKVLKYGNIYAKETANRNLAVIELNGGKPTPAIFHLYASMDCTDSIARMTSTETLRRMQSLYNYHLRERENVRLRLANKEKQLWIGGLVASCIILLVLLGIYGERHRRRQLQFNMRLAERDRLVAEQDKKRKEVIDKNNLEISTLEEKLRKIGQEKADLREQLERQKEQYQLANRRAEIALEEDQFAVSALLASEVCRLFLSKDASVTSSDWQCLQEKLDEVYHGFCKRLSEFYPFSEYEYHLCLLIKANVPPVQMSRLTCHSKESVTATRRRLYEKVFHEKGDPKKWDEFIRSL